MWMPTPRRAFPSRLQTVDLPDVAQWSAQEQWVPPAALRISAPKL